MKKYYKYIAILIAGLMFNCEADDESKLSKFVGFEQGPRSVQVKKDSILTREVKVAASETTGSDRTYPIYVDATSTLATDYVVPATVTIPANTNVGTFDVVFADDESLNYFDQTMIIQFEGQKGLDFSKPLIFNVTELCELTLVQLDLTFDAYPTEAVWEIYDLSGTPQVIYTGGSNSEYAGLEDYSIRFCLDAGVYGIAVYDLYGDGGTDYELSYKEDDTVISSGSTPDAGGNYPQTTNVSDQFTID